MGDVARRGYWRKLLNQYMRLPDSMRAFDRTDDPDRRVIDTTVFVARPSSVCPAGTTSTPRHWPIRSPTGRPGSIQPAEAGKRYPVPVRGGTEYVRLPDQPARCRAVPPLLDRRRERAREPWPVSFDEDLRPAAERIDELLGGPSRHHVTVTGQGALESCVSAWLTRTGSGLRDRPGEFTIDGVEHIVGLMNSGKTTLTDLITVDGVLNRGKRVCQVVSSVGDVYAKVSFLRALGIDAVPLIGRSSRGEHAARYWRTMVEESAALIPDEYHPAGSGGRRTRTRHACLSRTGRPCARTGRRCALEDFPCRGRLREAGAERPRACDCPLLAVCPAQKALREVGRRAGVGHHAAVPRGDARPIPRTPRCAGWSRSSTTWTC